MYVSGCCTVVGSAVTFVFLLFSPVVAVGGAAATCSCGFVLKLLGSVMK